MENLIITLVIGGVLGTFIYAVLQLFQKMIEGELHPVKFLIWFVFLCVIGVGFGYIAKTYV